MVSESYTTTTTVRNSFFEMTDAKPKKDRSVYVPQESVKPALMRWICAYEVSGP